MTHATSDHPDDPAPAALDPVSAQGGTRAGAVLTGLRQPIVVVLLLVALFTAISGKPVDGVLMLIAATCLAWEGARQQARLPGPARPSPAEAGPAQAGPERSSPGRRRPALIVTLLIAGPLYAVVVGTFTRYSWPATAAVVGLGCLVVAIGWNGPLRARQVPARLPRPGAAIWALLLVAGSLWELTSLLEQPSLEATSAAHPTISALTDPLLASGPGRSVALAAWLVIGWFVIER